MVLSKQAIIHQLTLKFTDYNRMSLDERIANKISKAPYKELVEYRKLGTIKAIKRLIKP